ncbi:MAG TPA: hypothetical protein VKV69_11175 [Actinomycetota bacterium]|nr:hypothetical protein [Actinomycetota bacterium]
MVRAKAALIVSALLLGAALAPGIGKAAGGPTAVAGIPANLVGVHGPLEDFFGGSQPLQLVGHADITPPGASTPLGNNGGIALIGDCAYVARWHDYGDTTAHPGTVQYPIQIVDISHPEAPQVVGSVPNTTIHDAVAREIRAIDLPGFKMLTVQTFGKYLDEGADTLGQNGMYYFTFPTGDCRKPVLAGSFASSALRPHEFFQWLDPAPAHNVDGHPRILDYVTTPLSGIDGYVLDASHPAKPQLIGIWHGLQPGLSTTEANLASQSPAGYGRYTHSISISPDGTKAYLSQWDGGFYTVNALAFAKKLPIASFLPLGAESVPVLPFDAPGNAHSAVAVPGTNELVVGDEIYVTTDGCPFGWMRILDQGNLLRAPRVISEFKLPENGVDGCAGHLTSDRNANGATIDGTFTMHNQTVTRHYVLTSWYGAGLRVIDITDPARPVEVSSFVPTPVQSIASTPDTPAPIYGATASTADDWWDAMWSYPVIRDGLIYVADVRNGLYILRPRPGTALSAELRCIGFTEGNSNLGSFIPSPCHG